MEQDTFTEIEEKYINRPFEEEHMSFEDFQKIDDIREKTKVSNKTHKERLERANSFRELQKGDRVYFTYKYENKSYNFIGTITSIKGKNRYSQEFEVENQIGRFKGLNRLDNGIRFRANLDYSHVEIPIALKEVPTKKLLNQFRMSRNSEFRCYGYYDSYYYGGEVETLNEALTELEDTKFLVVKGVYATILQMRAELSTREHVLSKFEKKIQRQLK